MAASRDRRRRDALLVAAAAFVIAFVSPVITSYDSRWSVPTAISLERHGDLTLDEYAPAVARVNGYGTTLAHGHTYDLFPWGTAVLVTPLVFVADRVGSHAGIDLERDALEQQRTGGAQRRLRLLEHGLASLIGAITAAVAFLFARERASRRQAFILAGVFVFGTAIWSVTTRALWSHGPAVLAVSIALLLAARARDRPALYGWLGVPVACAYVFRPTMSVVVIAFTVYVAVRARQQLLRFLVGGAAVALGFVAVNVWAFHAVLPPYFSAGRLFGNDEPLSALAGNLVSPARGLFLYSPVLLLAVIAFVVRAVRKQVDALDVLAMTCVATIWIVASTIDHWWGGATYGPRLMADTIPFLCWLLVPVVVAAFPEGSTRRQPVVTWCFVVALGLSVLVNARGAIDARSLRWNTSPQNVDDHPSRVWDWSDPQMLSELP